MCLTSLTLAPGAAGACVALASTCCCGPEHASAPRIPAAPSAADPARNARRLGSWSSSTAMNVTLAAARRMGTFLGMTQHVDALVVSAGVVGLTTAISLAEAGLVTRVLAADPPERTTSYVAGAIWGPVRTSTAGPALEWARVGLAVLSELAADPRAAIRQVSGIMVEATPRPRPDWLPILPDQRPLTAAELPHGFACGWRYTAPIVDMPAYLAYL